MMRIEVKLCRTGIGKLLEDASLLRKAADYIEASQAKNEAA